MFYFLEYLEYFRNINHHILKAKNNVFFLLIIDKKVDLHESIKF